MHRLQEVSSGGVQSSRGCTYLEVPGLHIPRHWTGWLGSPLWVGIFESILGGTPCLPASPLPYTHGCWRMFDNQLLGKEKAKFRGRFHTTHTM